MTTKIQWVKNSDGTQGRTWNPVVGCAKVSVGCQHCYAERMANRLKAMGRPEYQDTIDDWGRWTGNIVLVPERLEEPLQRKKPTTYFVCSMSDLFHPGVPDEYINEIWFAMGEAYQHTFQVLTKRPERMMDFVNRWCEFRHRTIPLDNVWLGVTAENQQTADERIPLLLQTPAVVRFVSAEPLLGPLDIRRYGPFIDWLIVGGESGLGARPMHPDWARSLRDQCQAAGVAFFFKQWGAWLHQYQFPEEASEIEELLTREEYWWPGGTISVNVGKKKAGHLLDDQEWNEMPKVHNAIQ